jgi:predicted N-acyltransferase
MQINIHAEISQILSKDWNLLIKENNPFLRHEFLAALENNGCVSNRFGWHSCHITATAKDWENFTRFYALTFAEKLPEQTLLILADNSKGECVAGSLMYHSDITLYGRHRGCSEALDKLHFEACYYQGIEFCIANQLQTFEPGAQGEHKIARGDSIESFVKHEQETIAYYMQSLKSPYKDQH